MEKMIKEKEESQKISIVPLDVIPVSQRPTTGTTTATISSTQTVSVDQVTKTLENMSL